MNPDPSSSTVSPTADQVYRRLLELLHDQVARELEGEPTASKALWLLTWARLLEPKGDTR